MERWLLYVVGGLTMLAVATGAGASELDVLPLGDPARALEMGSAGPGTLYDCNAGHEVDIADAVDLLAGAQVVLLGEDHTNMAEKVLQARLLDELAQRRKPIVLGLEFFQRDDTEALARWEKGELDDDGLLLATGWYDRGGYRFDYYRTVMAVARRHGIAMRGINIPRDIVRDVNRGGLDSLTADQRAVVGEVETTGSPQHRYLIRRYFGDSVAMMPAAWFDNMYAAQCVWDVAMARSILDDLPPDGMVVVVVGAGHVAFDLGIARRIHDECAQRGIADVRVASFAPVTAPPPLPADELGGHPMGGKGHGSGPVQAPALFARSLADVVGVFADTGGVEAFPSLGIKLGKGDDATTVTMVWPDTIAERAGLKSGDRILDVNGRTFADASHLRLLLADLAWGDRADLAVARGDERLSVAALLEPEITSSDDSTAPGFTMEPVAAVEPAAADSVVAVAPDLAPPELSRRLVSRDGVPLRVEVRLGDTLMVVHEVDAALRVVRSRYLEPLADGAVEVCYQRDADGTLLGTTRRDRAGEVVGGSE